MYVIEMERERALDLHALCYEHHVELFESRRAEGAPTDAYACPKQGCKVQYNISSGYFVCRENGRPPLMDFRAQLRCMNDGMPMYLAEVQPENRSFRLWRCPECSTVAVMNP